MTIGFSNDLMTKSFPIPKSEMPLFRHAFFTLTYFLS